MSSSTARAGDLTRWGCAVGSRIPTANVKEEEASGRELSRMADGPGGRAETIYLGDHRAITRTKYGIKLFFDTRDLSVGIPVALDGDWEPWLSPFLLSVARPGDVVVDVGANIGFYTTHFAARVGPAGRVHSFECNPALFGLLRDTVDINNLADRCTLYASALADRVGEIPFFQPAKHQGSGNVRGGGLENETFTEIAVPATTLDTVFPGGEPPVRLLHTDVESAEPLVIAGGHGFIERHRDMVVVIECVGGWFRNTGDDALRDALLYLQRTGRRLCLLNNNVPVRASIDLILQHEITNAVAIPSHLTEFGAL
ncbi:MAG: FkbM family methyltransferase [Candidatus Eremiobacteraeota bacterium]|nr:FkbM family methyltransferase [Candidatus Eremiobacteraeota bacterium]